MTKQRKSADVMWALSGIVFFIATRRSDGTLWIRIGRRTIDTGPNGAEEGLDHLTAEPSLR